MAKEAAHKDDLADSRGPSEGDVLTWREGPSVIPSRHFPLAGRRNAPPCSLGLILRRMHRMKTHQLLLAGDWGEEGAPHGAVLGRNTVTGCKDIKVKLRGPSPGPGLPPTGAAPVPRLQVQSPGELQVLYLGV